MNQQPLPIVIPRGGGTGSCSGGVRRQHCAGAPGGKPIVAQTDGAHTGASSAFAPAEHARKGHRPDGDGWVSPSDVYSPYYKNVAASDFDILPGGVAFTKHYTENTSFDYPNKAASLSFRYLDHPLVAHLVPYIRRPCRRTTVSPAYLAAIVRRALPIFEIHFKNYPSIPRSPLLSQFISALYSLSKLLPDELAAEVKRLVQPDLHATNIQLPITFELPTFPCLPRNTPSETYEYSDDERLAMSPFNDPVFKHIFPFWRHPEIILETDPDHIPALLARFRLGLSAFLPIVNRLNAMSQSFPPIVTAAIRNTAQAVQMFPPDGETYSWLVKLPDIWEHEVIPPSRHSASTVLHVCF
ncbi:hypothetical protein B0H14DRAFT_1200143 [Mycena olivaceomarginata]|nr:hypothetical protein B0H14DRAFT_1200143 [Mycena olivaceomarginata]